MSSILGITFEDKENLKIDLERLKQMFESLTRKIIELAKQEKIAFYFVIDGLELAMSGAPGERIIDLFPLPHHPRGLFILGSVKSSFVDKFDFNYECDDPNPFSITETQHYLQDIDLNQSQIEEIHEISGGLPGYLSLVKKMLKEKQISFSSILENQSELDCLLDEQWKKEVENLDDQRKKFLAIIAYSLTPLNSNTLAEIAKLPEDKIHNFLKRSRLLKQSKDFVYSFQLDIYKSIAQNRLKNLRSFALDKLTSYYETHPENKNSGLLLPEYYKQTENYEAIKTLVTPLHLTNTLLKQEDISICQRDLRNAIDLARENKDLGIMRFGLYSAQLRTLSNEMIGISEVEALISMERYDKALELAYSSKLEHLRIRLLAKIYLAMEKKGKTIDLKKKI
jgi:hypothetical protein